ncbi:MAG: ComF family protein [Melioribacteraceae bacterium]|nr:ComF family protein [Melioribacteraceae bacterium]
MNELGIIRYLNSIADFFLPRLCLGCSSKLEYKENIVCLSCIKNIKDADSKRINSEFERKFEEEKIISNFYSPFIFEKEGLLQDIIHSLKYSSNIKAGTFLGRLLFEKAEKKITDWNCDLLIPIPLHRVKKAERGYNQSYYITKELSKLSKIKMDDSSVSRSKFTDSQTNYNLKERKENISDAFKCRNGKNINGKSIILIDDVITTGSTITECGKVLKEKGAKNIFALSIAIAD